jgi:hypothetical protein
MIWPRQNNPATINPPAVFAPYTNAVNTIETAPPTSDDTKLLAQAWKLFDNESARRTAIDARASAAMPAITLAATLVTGVGFSVLKDTSIPTNAQWVIVATYLVTLLFLVRTALLVFVIQGKVLRNTPDPADLPPPPAPAAGATSPYDRALACKIMRYTIANYQINNIQADALFVAQRAFQNAIIAITLGGVVVGVWIFLHRIAPAISFGVAE